MEILLFVESKFFEVFDSLESFVYFTTCYTIVDFIDATHLNRSAAHLTGFSASVQNAVLENCCL